MAGNDENAPRKLPLEMRGCSREWRLTGFVANSHYRPMSGPWAGLRERPQQTRRSRSPRSVEMVLSTRCRHSAEPLNGHWKRRKLQFRFGRNRVWARWDYKEPGDCRRPAVAGTERCTVV